METPDPLAFVADFNDAWNAGDDEAIMAYFTPNATVRLESPSAEPVVRNGEAEILTWVHSYLPGFQATSTEAQAEGDRVTWAWKVRSDAYMKDGIGQVVGTAEAELQQGKAAAFTFTVSEVSLTDGPVLHGMEIGPELGGRIFRKITDEGVIQV